VKKAIAIRGCASQRQTPVNVSSQVSFTSCGVFAMILPGNHTGASGAKIVRPQDITSRTPLTNSRHAEHDAK
jgi:hypothetical protein